MFNDAQKEAVFHPINVPLIIIAPPGSGKTHCLVSRMIEIIKHGGKPGRM